MKFQTNCTMQEKTKVCFTYDLKLIRRVKAF
jgi:hypothetical protein